MNETFRRSFLCLSILYILFGLVLIIWPSTAKNALCVALGCILVLLGLLKVLRCWNGGGLGQLDGGAAGGVALLIGGVLLFTQFDILSAMMAAIIGLAIVVDGFIKLQLSCALKRLGAAAWKRDMVAALALMAVGVFLLFDPFAGVKAMTIITGIVLILAGLANGWMAMELGRAEK